MKLILVLSIALCTLISVSAVCTPDCAGDEHCDATSSTCLCNTTASSPGVNPSPTVNCSGGVLSIYVPKCWLENNGYNSSNVHLQSSACTPAKEVVNNLAELSFHVPLTSASCNNTAYINGTHVIYSNNLYIFAKKSLIQTRQDVVANVSCAYPLTANVTLNVTLHPIVSTVPITVPGSNAQVPLTMAGFTGSTFSTPITETTELFIDSTIYVSVTAGGLDASVFKVKVTDIYATPGDVNTPQYYLLKDGCPVTTGDAAGLLHVVSNGVDAESRFEVQVFQIAGSPTVNLYAQAVLCTSNCTVDCTGRAARDSSSDGPSATVDLRLAALAYDYPISSSSAVSWMLSTLIMSWGFVKLL